ncbi:MAG: hypothetical protein K5634_01825 [Sphaerochaetaceae bacterium]|nr:hypothetical protein [Sphaerochaetaceae bacterium]
MKSVMRVFALMIVLTVGMSAAFASDNYVHRVTLTPQLVYQHIYYKDQKYGDLDTLGAGMGLEYGYRLSSGTEACGSVSVEHYSYPGFYDYLDLKMAAKVKQQLFTVGNGPYAVFKANAGAGADWVFKSNGEKELYFLVLGGLSMDVLSANRYSEPYIGLKVEAQGTFQGGSTVLHVLGGLEISYSFGGSNGGSK